MTNCDSILANVLEQQMDSLRVEIDSLQNV